MKKNSSQAIIRYNFLSEWLETASKEEIIDKLIENDERHKLIDTLVEQNAQLCEMIDELVDKIKELQKIINN